MGVVHRQHRAAAENHRPAGRPPRSELIDPAPRSSVPDRRPPAVRPSCRTPRVRGGPGLSRLVVRRRPTTLRLTAMRRGRRQTRTDTVRRHTCPRTPRARRWSRGTAPGGPLAGLLVADFSRILAGPYATMLLADLGAEVVKVESRPATTPGPGAAGPRRRRDLLPRRQPQQALGRPGPQGRRRPALARELAHRADVLVENFQPGGLARFGLDYDTVSATQPAVVYASISGFGSGPGGRRAARLRPDRPGHLRADEPDRQPRRPALPRRHLGLRRDGRAARHHRGARRPARTATTPAGVSTSRSTCCPRPCPGWSTSPAPSSPAASSPSGWATATPACSPTSRCPAPTAT